MTDSLWRTVVCNKLAGIQGTAVKIQSLGGTQLTFCGVKVYGYQSDVDQNIILPKENIEISGIAIDIDQDDNIY